MIDELSHVYVAAKRIGQLICRELRHSGLQKTRATDHNHYCLSARGRDIESVQAVEKFHSARRVLGRGGRQRVNDNRCLLALKFIHRADSRLVEQSADGTVGRR